MVEKSWTKETKESSGEIKKCLERNNKSYFLYNQWGLQSKW